MCQLPGFPVVRPEPEMAFQLAKTALGLHSFRIAVACRLWTKFYAFVSYGGRLTECGESFVFAIPSPFVRRFIALLGAALFMCVAAYVPLKVGITRTYRGFEEHPALWCVVAVLVSGFALFLRLGFPPRRSLAKLHIRQNYVRITPGQIERLFGQPVIETALTAQSKEVLLCRSYSQGMQDGFRVIICAAGGREREIRASSMD
jgi:hypothetical protein